MASTSASSIARKLDLVRSKIAQAVARRASADSEQQCVLIAVSKTKPVEDLLTAYNHKQIHFGENYIQELITKAPLLPKDVKWHYIGHIQSNKAKALVRDVPNLYLVHTVDSIKIANALQKASKEFRSVDNPLNILIQVNTSQEKQKSGLTSLHDSIELAQHIHETCDHLKLKGLMTIGKNGDTSSKCFENLVDCRDKIASKLHWDVSDLELSMGMSADYELAIDCGSTMVRIGSTIFGARVRREN